MSYAAKPGSVADRALAFLQSQPPAGAEVSTSALADAIGATGEATATCLRPALDAGLVFARKKGGHIRSPLFWSLVDHAAKKNGSTGEAFSPANGSQKSDGGAASSPAAKAGSQTPPKGPNRDASTGQSHGAKGSASPNGRGNNVAPARGAGPAFLPAAAAPGLRIALWSDGVLQIERDTVGGAADLVLFSADETRQLVRYLERLAIDTEETAS